MDAPRTERDRALDTLWLALIVPIVLYLVAGLHVYRHYVIILYPVLWINFLFGLPALAYAVYLLYSGVPIMMNIPPEKGFLFASAVLAVGLVALVGLLASTVVLWSYGLGPAFAAPWHTGGASTLVLLTVGDVVVP